ncbi:MAG: hypothetical protein J5840_02735 [Lachnospiraceae bacterium]|nr:hypothetical protein [Lachnospiraceae bacterium]
MKTCPKCNEMIGDNIKICPMCKHEFTMDENSEFVKEKEEREKAEYDHFEAIRAQRAKMRRILSIIAIASLVVGGISGAILTSITGDMLYVAVLTSAGIAVEIIVMIYGIVGGAFRCPYCEGLLYRNYGKHCMHCGKRLY